MIEQYDTGGQLRRPFLRRVRTWGAFGRVGVSKAAVLGGAAMALGCGLVSQSDSETPREALHRNRSLWTSLALDPYQYQESKGCECIAGFVGPVVVTVENGQIAAVAEVLGGSVLDEGVWSAFDTIEDLFDLIAQALDQDAYVLEVTYDRDRGFPSRISVDFNAQAADDEVVIVAGGVTSAPSG